MRNVKSIVKVYEELIDKLLKERWIEGNKHLERVLKRTPRRAAKALLELLEGYRKDFKVAAFPYAGTGDQLVTCIGHTVYTICPHHLLPVEMVVSVGYVPRHKVLGLSKLPRLIDSLAHTLSLQEEFASELLRLINTAVSPKGAVVHVRGKHSCVRARGARSTSTTETLMAVGEVDKEEFLCLVRSAL